MNVTQGGRRILSTVVAIEAEGDLWKGIQTELTIYRTHNPAADPLSNSHIELSEEIPT